MLRFARNDENSRIPYRDPRVKPEDDIVGNSRIPKANLEFPKDEFRISRDCFASLAMTKILEFPASLRGSKATEAISSNRRHCEGAKRPKQSLRILEFLRLKIPPNPQPADVKQKTQIKQENSRF